jgi:hypothetical protein
MKIIFLDHFGVMCLADKHGIENTHDYIPRVKEIRVHGGFDKFDARCVEVLNSLLSTDVEVVVSSDWKNWASLDIIGEFYLSQGIKKKPISLTPTLFNIHNETIQTLRTREILKWLESKEIKNWVAIDDLYLIDLPNFVWVSRTDEGISQIGVKENINQYLNGKY